MKNSTIIVGLVLLVLVVFLAKPDLLGKGVEAPSLSVTLTGDTMTIPTDISCVSVQDCVDYAVSQDPTATDVRAVCDGSCTFITEKRPVVGVPQ
jgi:hypothetical protein